MKLGLLEKFIIMIIGISITFFYKTAINHSYTVYILYFLSSFLFLHEIFKRCFYKEDYIELLDPNIKPRKLGLKTPPPFPNGN
jgi:hypothetical protein